MCKSIMLALLLIFSSASFAAPNQKCPKNKKAYSCEGMADKKRDYICSKREPSQKRLKRRCAMSRPDKAMKKMKHKKMKSKKAKIKKGEASE